MLVLPARSWAESAGAPAFSTGAPGDATCTACHGGRPNTGSGRIAIQVPGGAETYVPGQKIRLTVLLEDGAARRWGFQLTARSGANPQSAAGTLAAVDGNAQVETAGGLQFATHTSVGTRRGTTGSVRFELDWTPPAEPGPVTFYAAGNAANGNASSDGDLIYTASLAMRPATAIVTETRVLPQLATGEEASTRIYLVNGGEAESTATVQFYKADGSLAGDKVERRLAAKGSAMVEAPGADAEAVWASVAAPPEVRGAAMMRAAGRESMVALNGAKAKGMITAFDLSPEGSTGRWVIVNPGDAEINVTLRARDEAGQVLSETTVAVKAKERVVVRELGETAGKRGTVEASSEAAFVMQGSRTAGESTSVWPGLEY
jgi:hypothetical protein